MGRSYRGKSPFAWCELSRHKPIAYSKRKLTLLTVTQPTKILGQNLESNPSSSKLPEIQRETPDNDPQMLACFSRARGCTELAQLDKLGKPCYRKAHPRTVGGFLYTWLPRSDRKS